jgi:hypothetical protein
MRYLLILIILITGTEFSNAQTGGSANSSTNKKRPATKLSREQRGTSQYHGSRDTTPGSPMGTGGAGGGEMSGSPAGSAIETNDQTSKTEANRDTISSDADTMSKKQTIKKTEGARRIQ